MPYTLFPQEPSQLAAMEMRLQNADLMQVHKTVEQLTDLSNKTGAIAQAAFNGNLFEAAMKRTEELNNQEICLNHKICQLLEEMNDLMIEKDHLTPDETAQWLNELEDKIFSCRRPSTPSLQQKLRSLKNQWNHLNFLYIFPVAEELNPNSFISNYFYRMSHRIEQMRPKDPEEALMLQKLLKDLQRECVAAEQMFCGKGDRSYRQLPEDIQIAIQQRLFAHDPDRSRNLLQNPEILAGAIMADLADRMIG